MFVAKFFQNKTIIDLISDQGNWQTLKSHVIKLITLAVILAIVRTFSRVLIFTPGRYVEYDLRKVIHAHLLTLHLLFLGLIPLVIQCHE